MELKNPSNLKHQLSYTKNNKKFYQNKTQQKALFFFPAKEPGKGQTCKTEILDNSLR